MLLYFVFKPELHRIMKDDYVFISKILKVKVTISCPHKSFAPVGLASLMLLNLNRCGIYDEGCESFKGISFVAC